MRTIWKSVLYKKAFFPFSSRRIIVFFFELSKKQHASLPPLTCHFSHLGCLSISIPLSLVDHHCMHQAGWHRAASCLSLPSPHRNTDTCSIRPAFTAFWEIWTQVFRLAQQRLSPVNPSPQPFSSLLLLSCSKDCRNKQMIVLAQLDLGKPLARLHFLLGCKSQKMDLI